MGTRCAPTRFSHVRTKHYQIAVARTVITLPYRPQQKPLCIKSHQNSSSNAVVNFGFPSSAISVCAGDGINGGRERGVSPSIKLLETFSSNAVVNFGFPSPISGGGGDGINGGRERGGTPSIKLLVTFSSNAVVNLGFPSPNSGGAGDGIKGGDGGGEGGGEEEEERFEGGKPMIGSPEIGRPLDSLGKYPTEADESGEIPYILDGPGWEPDESLFSGGLGRLMADEFFTKLLIECVDDEGLFPKNAAEHQKYKEKMLKELEIAAADVMRF